MGTWAAASDRGVPVRDALLVLALAALAMTEILASGGAHTTGRALFGLATIAGLVVRRSRPLLAALAVSLGMTAQTLLLESPDDISVLLAILVAAFSVTAYADPWAASAAAVILSAGVAFAVGLDPSDSPSNILPTLLLFVGIPAALGIMFRRRHRDIAALEIRAEALTREADWAVELERRRIARELHDVVSHAVTVIAVQAESGTAVIDTDPERARQSLASIAEVSREALAELHRLLGLLHEDSVAPDGGLDRVPALVAGVRAAGLSVDVREDGSPVPLDPVTDRCAYRVVQEGLTNALRHAPDGRVEVLLGYHHSGLTVAVESHGRRHTSAYGGTGRGLDGLRERVHGLGGDFLAGGTESGGFSVRATLPRAVLT